MAKLTGPIQEVSRALDLVPYLSTHSHVSLKELAREFGVSEKEMANELTALSMCGLPGYTPYELIEVFFESGFVSINNHDALDIPRALTGLEISSFLIGLELLRESIPGDQSEVLDNIDSLVAQLKSIVGDVIEVHDAPESNHRSVIESAIASRHSLEIAYLSPSRDEVSIRVVDPLSLYSEEGFTYLSAFCQSANDYRNFRLDRVERVTPLPLSTKPAPEGDPHGSTGQRFQVRATRNRRAVAELLQSKDLDHGGSAEIEVFSTDWLHRAVVAVAPDLEVVAPVGFREEIRLRGEKILALYLS